MMSTHYYAAERKFNISLLINYRFYYDCIFVVCGKKKIKKK